MVSPGLIGQKIHITKTTFRSYGLEEDDQDFLNLSAEAQADHLQALTRYWVYILYITWKCFQ